MSFNDGNVTLISTYYFLHYWLQDLGCCCRSYHYKFYLNTIKFSLLLGFYILKTCRFWNNRPGHLRDTGCSYRQTKRYQVTLRYKLLKGWG